MLGSTKTFWSGCEAEGERNLVIVQFSSARNGSAVSGLILANGLKSAGWKIVVIFSYPGPMLIEYERAGHACFIVSHERWLRSRNPIRFIKTVISECRNVPSFEKIYYEFRPDVVYINSAVSLSAALAARKARVKVIWHIRELFSDVGGELKISPILKYLARFIFRKLANILVVCSSAVAKNVLGETKNLRLSIVPNGVPEKFFENLISTRLARANLGLPSDSIIIGLPGTLRPVKGHLFFFRAMSELMRIRREKWCFAVTGDDKGEYAKFLKKTIENMGLVDHVRFLGDLVDMREFYSSCDIVCVPSKAEPFGRVVVEALAAQKPLIASDIGGIAEIVLHDHNGLLIEYGNVSSFVNSVIRLLDDEKLREKLIDNGRCLAERYYKDSVVNRRIVELVSTLVRDNGQITEGVRKISAD